MLRKITFFSRRRRIYKGLKQKHFYLGPTLTFNILKFASQLKTAGVPAVQAEVEAEALLEVFEANLSELVIKEGLRHEIKKLELRMTIKLVQGWHICFDLQIFVNSFSLWKKYIAKYVEYD